MTGQIADDAELIELGHLLDAAFAKEKEAIRNGCNDDEIGKFWEEGSGIVRKIEFMVARTVPGLQVKARAALWCMGGSLEHSWLSDPGAASDDRMIVTILRDLLAMHLNRPDCDRNAGRIALGFRLFTASE